MNILQKTISNPKVKILLLIIFVIIVIALFFITSNLSKSQPQNILTTPLIPATITVTPPKTINTIPLENTNPHNPGQKLVFNWGNLSSNIPSTIRNYKVSSPLVNSNTITNAANRLGFTAVDKSTNTSENSFLWLKDKISFFGSPKQNQIFYISSREIPKNTRVISATEAATLAKNIISNLFGDNLALTLSTNPEIKYLFLQPQNEEEPKDTSPETANIVNINFQQTIDNLPLLSLSKKGETFSVAIDTTNKLYLLYVHGGYLNLTEDKTVKILNLSELKSVAPSKALRISQAKDIPSEASFTKANTINVTVTNISLGYFHRADNSLFPVFVIKGNMSAKGLVDYPAIYIVPATSH